MALIKEKPLKLNEKLKKKLYIYELIKNFLNSMKK